MPNTRLAYEVVDDIRSNPQEWDQGVYIAKTDCGTAACFAGRTVLRAGAEPLDFTSVSGVREVTSRVLLRGSVFEISDLAEILLDAHVVTDDNEDLFDACNTLEDLERLTEELFGPRPADMPQKSK